MQQALRVFLLSVLNLALGVLAFAQSYDVLLAKALNGDQRSAFAVGVMLLEGTGGAPVDASSAARWFRRCADSGNPVAQTQLGFMYLEGVGVERDVHEAFRWLLRASSSGNAQAQFNLSIMYLSGAGVTPDPEQAFRWLVRAAEAGCPQAQMNLGLVYIKGAQFFPHVQRDPKKGMRWMREAANHRLLCAEYNLGVLYFNGIGTTAKASEAEYWFTRANSHVGDNGKLIDAALFCSGSTDSSDLEIAKTAQQPKP